MNGRAVKPGVFAALALALLASPAAASSGALPYHFEPNTGDRATLQRGARNYMNYCAGCHSLKYLRYNRIGKDLGIPKDVLEKNLMFTSDKAGDVIKAAMTPAEGEKWFGRAPPDLSLETRSRGPDWVYNYLLTFYLDPARPTGVNNLVLKDLSMPHVLGELQGWQRLVPEGEHAQPAGDAAHGYEKQAHHGPKFELVQPGALTPEEYKAFVADLTNFMVYAAEPGRNDRFALGWKVMIYLVILTILAYFLKVEYWKDVH